VLCAAALPLIAAVLFAPGGSRNRIAGVGATVMFLALAGHLSGLALFDVTVTKGHPRDRVLFSKWNSFSRIGVYDRTHENWSLSSAYKGPLPDSRYMDIDSAASTPILHVSPDLSNAQYLKYELTAFACHLKDGDSGFGIRDSDRANPPNPESRIPNPGFTALVIGPGGGRDLVSALVFGARHVDGVEINPIIADN
jgi:hypothetical protein